VDIGFKDGAMDVIWYTGEGVLEISDMLHERRAPRPERHCIDKQDFSLFATIQEVGAQCRRCAFSTVHSLSWSMAFGVSVRTLYSIYSMRLRSGTPLADIVGQLKDSPTCRRPEAVEAAFLRI
jgi:hypothetical protein